VVIANIRTVGLLTENIHPSGSPEVADLFGL
jgi:hypothetical protein